MKTMSIFSRSRLTSGLLLLAFLAAPLPRAAAQGVESTAAQALFEEGRRLFEAQRFDEACEKFAESQQLEAALGTLLNLALCNERRGKRASAWLNYSDALTQATREGNEARAAFARERIEALAPGLSKLVIEVASDAPGDLWVKVDGVPVGRGAWGLPLPVDGPSMIVQAGAAGRQTFAQQVSVEPAHTRRVKVGSLAPTAAPALEGARSGGNLRLSLGAASAGVAVTALLGAGAAYLGVRRLWDERNRHCPGGRCDGQAVQAGKDAHRLSVVSTVGLGVGVAAAAAATYLLISARRGPLRVGASLARDEGHLFMSGAF
jgi:hypothetical protein